VTNYDEGQYANSRPGSFVDPSSYTGEIDADQEYRSNGDEAEEFLDDVNIDVNYE